MGNIQGSINSLLGSFARATIAVKGYKALKAKNTNEAPKVPLRKNAKPETMPRMSMQEAAAELAKQRAADAVAAREKQRNNWIKYFNKQRVAASKADRDTQQAEDPVTAILNRIKEINRNGVANGKHK